MSGFKELRRSVLSRFLPWAWAPLLVLALITLLVPVTYSIYVCIPLFGLGSVAWVAWMLFRSTPPMKER